MKPISSSKVIMVSVLVLLGVCMSLLTTGCQARARKMTPQEYEVVKNHRYSVSVNESTVQTQLKESMVDTEPNPRWGAGISRTEFTWALTDALEQSGVFRTVKTTGDTADYILDVAILDYDKPWYGSGMTVRLETKWVLTDAKKQKVVWSNTFPTAHKVEWIRSLGSMTDRGRAQRAQELAAQANIKEGIKRLSTLKL